MGTSAKKIVPVLISTLLLGLIYWKVDLRAVWRELVRLDAVWLVASFALSIPILGLMALRLQFLVPERRASFGESLRLILAACVLNLVLPSKMGDLAKAWWMHRRSGIASTTAFALVVLERITDLMALCFWGCLGVVLYRGSGTLFWGLAAASVCGFVALTVLLVTRQPALMMLAAIRRLVPKRWQSQVTALSDSWQALLDQFWGNALLRFQVSSLSLAIWLLHLGQIWMFTRALGIAVPFGAALSLNAFAILVGLLPFTFAGVGTRDAALVLLYRGILSPAAAAATGMFCTIRYVLPALAGLPFFHAILAQTPAEPANRSAAAPLPHHKGTTSA